MQLIGMLDSPYVRRSAISLALLEIPFEHRPVSVFRHFDEFRSINPVVKAPTLVCDDGTVLMDSNLILDYAESLAAPGRSLMPQPAAARLHGLRVLGLALAACEKSISIVYEHQLRPAEKQHAPWIERVTGQLVAACSCLEAELRREQPETHPLLQPGITSAVAWQFLQMKVPEVVVAGEYPAWSALSAEAEKLATFSRFLPE
jgi:glutathione S-transferase